MKRILKYNKTYKYKYAIFTSKKSLVLFNESSVDYYMGKDEALLNVEILLDKNGFLHIKGERIIWKLASKQTNINTLKYEVHEKSIKHDNGFKLFGIKPMDYVEGWYRLKNLEKFKMIIKDCTIEIKD